MTDDREAFFAATREVIGKRIPAVLVPGPTVERVRPYVKALSPYVAWCGISKWWYLERELLAPHDARVQWVWCGCELTIRSEIEFIADLLAREESTMFVSKPYGLTGMRDTRPELVGHPRVWVSDMRQEAHLNALGGALLTLMVSGQTRVLTIGADGQAVDGKRHFGEDEYARRWEWYDKGVRMDRVTDEMLKLENQLVAYKDRFTVVNISDASVWKKIDTFGFDDMPDVIDVLQELTGA